MAFYPCGCMAVTGRTLKVTPTRKASVKAALLAATTMARKAMDVVVVSDKSGKC